VDSTISEEQAGVKVNLLLSKKTEALDLESYIPRQGKVGIRMHKTVALFVRIASWVNQKDLVVKVDGKVRSRDIYTCYLSILEGKGGTLVEIQFPQRKAFLSEEINEAVYGGVVGRYGDIHFTRRDHPAPLC
jgi:hypothetical protein